jgi:uncharacterized protein YeaC (DUF1315 family)
MEFQNHINNLYNNIFDKLQIDKKTGILPNGKRRFATKMAIRENYQDSEKNCFLLVSILEKMKNLLKQERTLIRILMKGESLFVLKIYIKIHIWLGCKEQHYIF